MIQLDAQDFQQTVAILQSHPLMRNAESRHSALTMAGLQTVIPLINLEGSPLVVSISVVDFLSQYGRLTYDNEALGLFLNMIKASVGKEQQETLGAILVKYKMMEPIAPAEPVKEWKGVTSDAGIVEKIFGENTLRPVAFLARGLEVARSVVYIGVKTSKGSGSGTGFLITPNLVMTNHHVLSSADQLSGVTIKANYQENFRGEAEPTKVYTPQTSGVFHANKSLDYAIFEVAGDPGKEWGYLPLEPRSIAQGDRINIIQHPYGQPKQLTIQNNLVEYVGGDRLQYVTSTNPGSSGSPVFSDDWLVVGLHHAGGYIPEPTTNQYYNRNEGILISAILSDMPAELRKRVDEAAK